MPKCPKHPLQEMHILFQSYACDVCDGLVIEPTYAPLALVASSDEALAEGLAARKSLGLKPPWTVCAIPEGSGGWSWTISHLDVDCRADLRPLTHGGWALVTSNPQKFVLTQDPVSELWCL